MPFTTLWMKSKVCHSQCFRFSRDWRMQMHYRRDGSLLLTLLTMSKGNTFWALKSVFWSSDTQYESRKILFKWINLCSLLCIDSSVFNAWRILPLPTRSGSNHLSSGIVGRNTSIRNEYGNCLSGTKTVQLWLWWTIYIEISCLWPADVKLPNCQIVPNLYLEWVAYFLLKLNQHHMPPALLCICCLWHHAGSCHSSSLKWLVFYFVNNIVIMLITLKQNIFYVEKGATLKMSLSFDHMVMPQTSFQ